MKKSLLIISTLVIASCSNHKSDIVGVQSGGEYFAVDNAAKETLVQNNEREHL